MSNFERTTSWQQIQQGVKEAERLIVSKDYNLVMVKARQTLECMVRCLAEKACLVDGDLADTIDLDGVVVAKNLVPAAFVKLWFLDYIGAGSNSLFCPAYMS